MPKGAPEDQLDPKFILGHAKGLITSAGGGRPPTIDARRAASAAYYAAYHTVTRAVSYFLFGESWINGVRWFSHRAVFDASRLVSRLGPPHAPDPGRDPEKVRDHAVLSIFQDAGGAKPDLLDTMEALRSLKVERETSDYDRTQRVSRATARELVDKAELVHAFFESSRAGDRDTRVFLALAALKA